MKTAFDLMIPFAGLSRAIRRADTASRHGGPAHLEHGPTSWVQTRPRTRYDRRAPR